MESSADSVFHTECVLLDMDAPDKGAVIKRMVRALCEARALPPEPASLTPESLTRLVLEREAEMATGTGNGFAFPHTRVPGLDAIAVAFARMRNGVDFGAPDGQPAVFIFLMILPADRPQMALTLMAAAARLGESPVEQQRLERERDPASLARFLTRALLNHDAPILARDLMREPILDVFEDMPLHEVTRALALKDTHATSVVKRDGTIVGQITCEDLFRVGMPDFFSQLKSISFIREFDPFDDYFKFERGACARDVMTQHYAALPEDATLVEVIFELAVKRHPKVYVVRDGKRVGIIDPFVVLDRVIRI
jgi:PTS system nitrogen regulatory IIA component